MQAIQINQYGDIDVLENVEIPMPQPAVNQVLVQLKAAAVNPVDYKIRSGYLTEMLPKTFPFTLGWEGAGIITALGEEVTRFKKGDEVMIMANFMQGGTYAEYVSVNEDEVLPKPQNLSFEEAAILPFSLGTAYTALVQDAEIQPDQNLLILGAGGAVGQFAVQIAKNKGLDVIGTAKGDDIQELKDLGIDQVIDYTIQDFTDEVSSVDVILDLVGGEFLNKAYALVKKGGKIISTTQPPLQEQLDNHGISGKMTFTVNNSALFNTMLQELNNGDFRIKQPDVLPLEKAKEALHKVEKREAKAKIVLTP